MSTRIPPLLHPYIHTPPKDHLILLTSVLGASTNWLVLRFLYNALAPPSNNDNSPPPTILMISFLRDRAFWVEGARRLGLDLEREPRWEFLDGLKDTQMYGVREVLAEVGGRVGGRVVVVVDGVDWLAVGGGDGDGGDEGGVEEMVGAILDMEHVHSAILTASSPPLPSPAKTTASTLLESAHASLLATIAHRADYVMAVRLLDTGVARDCSGVLRITVGDGAAVEEGELMFWVGGGGGVRVWERGGEGR